MQRWWVRAIILIPVCLAFIYFILWAVGQQNEPELAKVNQRIEALNRITPEQYYNKTKEELIRQKIFYEEQIKLYSQGTKYVFYQSFLGMPKAIKHEIPEMWKKIKEYKEKEE